MRLVNMRKHRKDAVLFAGFLLLVMICGFALGCSSDLSASEPTESMSQSEAEGRSALAEIVFVKTKEDADCAVLMDGNHTVVIDTGESQDYSHIKRILEEYSVQKIDCMILTHPDKDHIGSAKQLARDYPIALVLEPIYDKPDERYDALNTFLDAEQIPRQCLSEVWQKTFGNLNITVYPPEKAEYKKDNNYSLATLVTVDEVSLFFTGDAMKKRTDELLELPVENVDLYKMSYHGRWYKGADALFDKMNAKYIVVTSDHVEEELMQKITDKNVYYTRESDWRFVSDGKTLEVSEISTQEREYGGKSRHA